VPEPASMLLLGTGLAGALARRRSAGAERTTTPLRSRRCGKTSTSAKERLTDHSVFHVRVSSSGLERILPHQPDDAGNRILPPTTHLRAARDGAPGRVCYRAHCAYLTPSPRSRCGCRPGVHRVAHMVQEPSLQAAGPLRATRRACTASRTTIRIGRHAGLAARPSARSRYEIDARWLLERDVVRGLNVLLLGCCARCRDNRRQPGSGTRTAPAASAQ